MDIFSQSLNLHKKLNGKIEIRSKIPLSTKKDLSLVYTPGVGEVARFLSENKEDIFRYTIKGNTVAVISDGSAVLGLGNIGPEAALPVMEGKALLFKELAGIDAFPICLASQNSEKTIETIRNIAPVFGGINLEDFKAPECFEIEHSLQDLGIPVMHDDQHGTAVVVLAALINALKVVGKKKEDVRVVINGAGAAGTAVAKFLLHFGFSNENIIVCDTKGIIYKERLDLVNNGFKKELAELTNRKWIHGTLTDALVKADVFIGVSKGNIVTTDMIRTMNDNSVVFALANPTPEILPPEALTAGAKVIATGRSDFPNQVNNVLAFPGIFRGALDARALQITTRMKLAAAEALATMIPNPTTENILPSPLDKTVVSTIASAVKNAWKK